jgi:hypothetical protein
MPVQTPHPDYAFRLPDWQKVRAFAEGARVVRAAGETYLPKPTGWSSDEYNAYRARAEVYGATDRTIDGLDGAIFRKPPKIEGLESAQDLVDDVTLAGNTLTEWLRDLVREILGPGRRGVLVEFSGSPDDPATRGNGTQRPYLVNYAPEQIINWETANIGGKTTLTMVVLQETSLVPSPSDPFVRTYQTRFRVLRLVEGRYLIELWTPMSSPNPVQSSGIAGSAPKTEESVFEKTAEIVPTRRGVPLSDIPFFFIGPSGQSATPEKPPLLDVVDLCILHYMTSADYAHGLHWVGLPTPWATGVRDKERIGIGPTTMIVLEDPEAKLGMLEFTGTGLSAVRERLDGLEHKMAALGARILEEQKKQAESGEALKLRQSGEASVLAGISDAVSRAAEAIVRRMLWWNGADDDPDITISLNMEFFGAAMDPQLLTALMQARQSGEISRETFLWNLQKGEMLPEDRTIEDEMAKIKTEAPDLPARSAAAGGA